MDQNQAIKDFLRDELDQFDWYLKCSIRNDNPRIANIVDYTFRAEGKHIRPILVFLAAKACGKITPATFHGAVTVELLHMATLIHDDVVDESMMRRSQPSVNAVFDNRRAVLVGDYFLSSALRESIKTRDFEIIEIIAELGLQLTEGELNQYAIANELLIDETEYFRVIDKKTASLFQACTKIGAITAGADRNTIGKFEQFGKYLGICFQIRDDIFDYYNVDVGKPTGSDIREGKITLPLIYALDHAPENISNEMLQIIKNQDYSLQNIDRLLSFAKENGGIDYAYFKIDEYLSKAKELVADFSFGDELNWLVKQFLSYLRERHY
jgi:octaprenyl-diphosphate synthase